MLVCDQVIVEANTGNEWWHPWWLVLWKAGCVCILLFLLLTTWVRRRRKMRTEPLMRGPEP